MTLFIGSISGSTFSGAVKKSNKPQIKDATKQRGLLSAFCKLLVPCLSCYNIIAITWFASKLICFEAYGILACDFNCRQELQLYGIL